MREFPKEQKIKEDENAKVIFNADDQDDSDDSGTACDDSDLSSDDETCIEGERQILPSQMRENHGVANQPQPTVAGKVCSDAQHWPASAYYLQVKDWTKANPGKVICIGASATMIAGPGLLAGSALGFLGFGGGGVVAGSIAAGVQSMIGNVAAGGLFATLTSAGAGGGGLAAVTAAVQGAGIAVGAAGAGAALAGRREPGQGDGEHKDDSGDSDDYEGLEVEEVDGDEEDEDGTVSKVPSKDCKVEEA